MDIAKIPFQSHFFAFESPWEQKRDHILKKGLKSAKWKHKDRFEVCAFFLKAFHEPCNFQGSTFSSSNASFLEANNFLFQLGHTFKGSECVASKSHEITAQAAYLLLLLTINTRGGPF